jgi:hypothetical protein
LGGFLRYGRPLFGGELFGTGFAAFQVTAPPELAGQLTHLFIFGHARLLA